MNSHRARRSTAEPPVSSDRVKNVVCEHAAMTARWKIGPFVLDGSMPVLMHAGASVGLGKRAVKVLEVLVAAAPEYVSKVSLIEAAWPGVIVEESNLAVQISAIRRALAKGEGEGWLETLPGRGYRFVGPVTRVAEPAASRASVVASNLPEPLTSLVGRERERQEVNALLGVHRLVTLTGTGGVGKTRLALSVASGATGRFPDGVWLVELSPLSDRYLVPQAVASALGLKEEAGVELTKTLIAHLRSRQVLVVLDNAEHVLSAAAQLIDGLLRHCPAVRVLVTSREHTGVPGEQTYRVPSLSLPDTKQPLSARALGEYEAVQLFVERARLHVPQFAFTDRNAEIIATICWRLDGIALAIELAAARLRSMTVDEINERLDHRFALLTGAARMVPPRQQTLRAAIDWSYALLRAEEKRVLCTASVFAGGFTSDALERVVAEEPLEQADVLDVLTSLVDKSLVVAEDREGRTRYRLLESLQQYAAEQLPSLADVRRCYQGHLQYFVQLAESAEPKLTASDQQTWLDRLELEHDNLRVALTRSTTAAGDAEVGLRLASALSRFWFLRGYLREGRGWLTKLLASAPDSEDETHARAQNWAGIFASKQGDHEGAKELFEGSLRCWEALNDRRGMGTVLSNQGLLAYDQGDYRAARALHEQSLAIDRELGDQWGIAVSLIHLSGLAMVQGDYAAARALNDESLALFRESGDRAQTANALRHLGKLYSQEGDNASARELFHESVAICRELGDQSGIAWALNGLGVSARHEGDEALARQLFDESLAIFEQLGDREGTASSLHNLGLLAASRGDHDGARAYQEQCLVIYRELRDRSGAASSIEALAMIALDRGHHARALRLWASMDVLRAQMGAPIAPPEQKEQRTKLDGARKALGRAAADRAWREGQGLSLDAAIAAALEHPL
jgi:non-specific serine/threonine protein kinase